MEDVKSIERADINRTETLREVNKPKPKPKEGKSPFDELLDQSRQLGQGLADTKTQAKTATKEAATEADRLKERQRDRSKDSEKEEEKKQDSGGEKREVIDGGKKVMGKADLKQRQGGSSGREGGDGTSGKKGDRSVAALKKLSNAKMAEVGSHSFAKEFQVRLLQAHPKIPANLSQQVLNQIVKTVRFGIAKAGFKTLEMDCSDSLFQGLTLRFQSRNGKVAVAFLTANRETKALFEKEAGRIRQTLEEKGVVVETIEVAYA